MKAYFQTWAFALMYLLPTLAQAEDILIVRGNENYPPHEFIQDGELIGFHIELVTLVAQSINIETRFESYPWKRAISMIKRGEADAITYASATEERKKFAYFIKGNIISESASGFISLASRANLINFDGQLKSIKDYTIGVQLGYAYGNEFDNANNLNKVNIKSIPQMFQTLRKGRIDLGMFSLAEYKQYKKEGIIEDIVFIKPYVSEFRNYIAFSKPRNRLETAQRFAKAMETFKTTERYLSLAKKYGVSR